MSDPWAIPESGFEPYAGPASDDGFQPIDRKASDLRAFLRTVRETEVAASEQFSGWVVLANGARGHLTQKADGSWELAIHLQRDFFQVFTAPTRDEVLRVAGAV